jgi:H+/Cl- antiporter ClcA
MIEHDWRWLCGIAFNAKNSPCMEIMTAIVCILLVPFIWGLFAIMHCFVVVVYNNGEAHSCVMAFHDINVVWKATITGLVIVGLITSLSILSIFLFRKFIQNYPDYAFDV